LPVQSVWMGWSLGGLLAMAMARWQPAYVQALVLVSTSPRFITGEDWPHAMPSVVLQQFAQQLESDTIGTLRRFLALQVKGSKTARQQLRTLNIFLKKTAIPQPLALQEGLQLLQNTDLRAELLQIDCPALLCLGGRDTLVPVNMGKDCQQWWPTLRTIYLQQAAHIPFLSHPSLFMDALQGFLNDVIAE